MFFFFSSRRRHTRWPRDWSSDVCSSDLHEKAAYATDCGFFESQIVPIETEHGTITQDEGIRRGGTVEKLAKLDTVFKEDGVIQIGRASCRERMENSAEDEGVGIKGRERV